MKGARDRHEPAPSIAVLSQRCCEGSSVSLLGVICPFRAVHYVCKYKLTRTFPLIFHFAKAFWLVRIMSNVGGVVGLAGLGSNPTRLPISKVKTTGKKQVQIRKKPVSGLQKRSGPTHPTPWSVYQLVKKNYTWFEPKFSALGPNFSHARMARGTMPPPCGAF